MFYEDYVVWFQSYFWFIVKYIRISCRYMVLLGKLSRNKHVCHNDCFQEGFVKALFDSVIVVVPCLLFIYRRIYHESSHQRWMMIFIPICEWILIPASLQLTDRRQIALQMVWCLWIFFHPLCCAHISSVQSLCLAARSVYLSSTSLWEHRPRLYRAIILAIGSSLVCILRGSHTLSSTGDSVQATLLARMVGWCFTLG